jgi:hypothetical protein
MIEDAQPTRLDTTPKGALPTNVFIYRKIPGGTLPWCEIRTNRPDVLNCLCSHWSIDSKPVVYNPLWLFQVWSDIWEKERLCTWLHMSALPQHFAFFGGSSSCRIFSMNIIIPKFHIRHTIVPINCNNCNLPFLPGCVLCHEVVSNSVQIFVLYVAPLLTESPIEQLPPVDKILSSNQLVEFDGAEFTLRMVQ